MNDEQKAKSMWYNWCQATTCHGIINCANCPHAHAHSQLLEMAKWKEQQCAEKVLEFVSEHFYNHPHDSHLVCSDSFWSVSDLMEQIEETIKKDEKK